MRPSFQIALVVLVTYVLATVVGTWSLAGDLPEPKLAPVAARERARTAELNGIFRNSWPDLTRCGLTTSEDDVGVSHQELVRVARCLEREHLVTPAERRAIEQDTGLRLGGSRVLDEATVEEWGWAWQETAVWIAGALVIAALVYRHRRREHPADRRMY